MHTSDLQSFPHTECQLCVRMQSIENDSSLVFEHMLCEHAKQRSVLLHADTRPATAQVLTPDFSLFFDGFTRKGVGKYVLRCFGFVHCLPMNWFYLCSVSVTSARLSA
jgi:hypothetical protein